MDNASKALIMAGAILIAVMLISLGVLLYNRSAEQAESSIKSVESIGLTAFNEQFSNYIGNNVKSSTVKNLITKVLANNAVNDTQITLVGVTDVSSVVNSSRYNVSISGYATTGEINSITITQIGS